MSLACRLPADSCLPPALTCVTTTPAPSCLVSRFTFHVSLPLVYPRVLPDRRPGEPECGVRRDLLEPVAAEFALDRLALQVPDGSGLPILEHERVDRVGRLGSGERQGAAPSP